MARSEGRACHAISFVYGQRHEIELAAAKRVAAAMGVVEHIVCPLDLRIFGGSALTDDIAVPKDAVGAAGIPARYVPGRNMIFLARSLGLAEARGAEEIWIGVNAVDYSGSPDCRPDFIDAFQQVILRGTKSGVEHRTPRLVAPLITMSKRDIIRRDTALSLDYAMNHSCYDPAPDGTPRAHR